MPLNEISAPKQTGADRGLEVRVARSVAEVEALRAAWMAWPGHRDSDIDFYLMIIQSYAEVIRPHVIALYRDGKPEVILVGRLEKKRIHFPLGYFAGRHAWARCLTFVYGPIHGDASPQNTEILVREVMNSLKRGEADVAKLELVPTASALYRLALRVPGFLSRDTLPASQGHDSMVVPDSLDKVYRRMSSHRRIELRRGIRKLESNPAGVSKIVCYRTPAELDRLFHDAEEIARKTYQRGLGVGFADNPLVRRRLELGAQKGWLRAYLLYLGERPCAFWIGMLYHGSFMAEYTGYDPEFRQLSPGMALMMRVIEGFCNRAEGDIVKELDFGPGEAEYKGALCSKAWQEAYICIFSPTPRGLLLKSLRAATRVVDVAARKVLTATKLLPLLKRLWRDRLAQRGQLPSTGNKPIVVDDDQVGKVA